MQLFQQLQHLIPAKSTEPTVSPGLDTRQPFSTHSIRYDDLYLAFRRPLTKRLFQLPVIMPVDPLDLTTKCPELISQRLQRHQLLRTNISLKLISVHHQRQIIQPIRIRHQQCLPYAALIQFAVTRDHNYAIVTAAQFAVQRNTGRYRGKMSQRTGMKFNPGDMPVRMPVNTVLRGQMIRKPPVSSQPISTKVPYNAGTSCPLDKKR
jgi:hypothetical protein